LEPVGEVGADERDVSGCEQDYSIAAPEDVVFSGTLERILRMTVNEEREETGERKYSRESTRGRIVNEEKHDLDEIVECKWESLHSNRPVGVCELDVGFDFLQPFGLVPG
jgi:hypothetical protein